MFFFTGFSTGWLLFLWLFISWDWERSWNVQHRNSINTHSHIHIHSKRTVWSDSEESRTKRIEKPNERRKKNSVELHDRKIYQTIERGREFEYTHTHTPTIHQRERDQKTQRQRLTKKRLNWRIVILLYIFFLHPFYVCVRFIRFKVFISD